jgi:hypothetical protein
MNIFWLSLNLKRCAMMHCDKHVVKMILEYAQMLSTAHHVLDGSLVERVNKNGKKLKSVYEHENKTLYKSTHVNHPCTIWVRENKTNYIVLYNLFCYLCKEYTHRYGKIHKTETKLSEILSHVPKNIPEISEKNTKLPIAIANKEIHIFTNNKLDIVKSYREYYVKEKITFATWKNRKIPKWMVVCQ